MTNIILALLVLASLALPVQSGAATYYVSTTGSDSAIGSEAEPWQTIRRAFDNFALPHMQSGDTLIFATGEYDTAGTGFINGSLMIPSGTNTTNCLPWPREWECAWSNPTVIKAAPGATVVWRRFIATSTCGGAPCTAQGATETQIRDGVHLATPAECIARNAVPYPCWSGGGNAPGYLAWYDVSTYQTIEGYVMALWRPSQYVVFDGIHFDGRGIVKGGTVSLSCNTGCTITGWDGPKNIRFQDLEIRNSTASCVNMPGAVTEVATNYQFINVKIHDCGVPYDTNYYAGDPAQGLARLHPNARFYHPWYAHTGHNYLINSEVYSSAGTGLAPDGDDNVVRGNFIHDNATFGIDFSGGKHWLVENNLFYNNGPTGIRERSGAGGHIFRNNTVVGGPSMNSPTSLGYRWGLELNRGAFGMLVENNIFQGFTTGIRNDAEYFTCYDYSPNNTVRNNLIYNASPGQEIVTSGSCSSDSRHPGASISPPILSGNILNSNPLLTACNNTACTDSRLSSTSSPAYNAGFNNGLVDDRLGNVRPLPVGGTIDIGADEYCTTGCNTPPTTGVLTVLSTGQATGVSIPYTVTGGTCTPSSPVVTSSSSAITCGLNATVTLTAPATSTNGNFGNWVGCTTSDSVARTCSKLITGGAVVTANYGTTHTLTVTSLAPTSGIVITLGDTSGNLNPDLDGKTGCTTSATLPNPCVFTFATDAAVSISAPEIIPGVGVPNYFGGWTNCPVPQTVPNYSVCKMQMGVDRTIIANFSGNGCHIHKDLTRPPWNSTNGLAVTLCDGPIGIFTGPPGFTTRLGHQPQGATGVIVGNPIFYDGDSDYIYVDFTVNTTPCSDDPVGFTCRPDGYLTTFTTLTESVLDTTITTSPALQSTNQSPVFEFTASGGTGPYTFQCSLDGAAFSTCSSPKSFAGLAYQSHTFQVRAIDSVPTTDATPASYTWSIVPTLPPTIAFTGGPTQPTSSSQSATFTFTASGCSASGCSLQCHLDGAVPTSCTSGIALTNVPAGNHIFYVRAIDNGTSLQSTEASYSWAIVLAGGGTFDVNTCVQIIAPNGANFAALNINDGWLYPGGPAVNFIGTQPFDAIGVITHTNATLNAQGRTGIRVNWRFPQLLPNGPGGATQTKNRDADTGSAAYPIGDPDGWISVNAANIKSVTCPPITGPVTPPTPTGSVVTKIGGGAIITLGEGTTKGGTQ